MSNSDFLGADLGEAVDRLQEATLFLGFQRADVEAMLGLMVQEEFAAEEVIIRQETITRNVWLLDKGECLVVKEPPIGAFGAPVPLAQLGPADVFGEMTLISARPHVATVEAVSEVRAVRLKGADFDRLCEDQPRLACQLACNLLRISSDRLRAVDEQLTEHLDEHQDLQIQHTWKELRGRLGKLYGGSPR